MSNNRGYRHAKMLIKAACNDVGGKKGEQKFITTFICQ